MAAIKNRDYFEARIQYLELAILDLKNAMEENNSPSDEPIHAINGQIRLYEINLRNTKNEFQAYLNS